MNPAEEVQAALDEVPAEPEVVEEQPAAPAAQPTAAEIGQQIAQSIAQSFGQTRVEGSATPAQRRITLKERIASFTPEQRQEFESRFLANPTGAAIELMELAGREQIAEIEERSQPLISSTGSLLVDSFMSRKANSDRYYRQIAPIFSANTANLNKGALVGLSEGDRTRQLDIMWEAAAAKMFRDAAGKPPTTVARAPVAVGGRGGAPAASKSGKTLAPGSVYGKGDDLQRLVETMKKRGTLTDDDLIDLEANHMDDY
jgi:hypothetical protein